MADIFTLSDTATDQVADADPILATELGLSGRDHLWPDLSPHGHQERHDLFAGLADRGRRMDTPDERSSLARAVLVTSLDEWAERIDAGDHLRDLNNIASPHQAIRQSFDMMARETADDWSAIVSRLETIDDPLDGYRASLDEGRHQGLLAARRQVETVIEQGQVASGPGCAFESLVAAHDDAGLPAGDLRDRLTAAVEHAKACYAGFNDYLAGTYLPEAPVPDAVGEERYVRAAREFLGTDIDPRRAYEWGWTEIERIWARLQEVAAAIDPDRSVPEVIEMLHTDPARAANSLDEFIGVMKQRQDQALANLAGTHFDVPEPIRRLDVQVEPAGGALAPHYTPPSEDFSRPGTVWYPVAGRDFFPLFEEVTTAYHEGFPGHHLQVGLQVTLADQLSRFHRLLVWYPGSGEGWALYAERLMGELGYLERPDYEVGLLASQLLRACRIAIDIGSHLDLPIPATVGFHPGERWNFDLAVELLTTRALQPAASARSEVIRYLGWPGQAISYKIGEQAILDLRAELSRRSGFDLRTFHTDLLSLGSLGLDLTLELMRR